MNKRFIVASLNEIANKLDIMGLYKEANLLTDMMKRFTKTPSDNKKVEEKPNESTISPDTIMREEDIPSRNSPGNQLSQYDDESAKIKNFLTNAVSDMTEDELPRWIKEKRDRAQNPPEPQVPHPSEVDYNQMVEDVYSIFMEQYEQFWDQHDVALPADMDPRIINEMTDFYLVIGKNNPVEFLKTEHEVTSGKYKDWFQQNFDFLVAHMKFVEDFAKSHGIGVGIMVKLLQKIRGH